MHNSSQDIFISVLKQIIIPKYAIPMLFTGIVITLKSFGCYLSKMLRYFRLTFNSKCNQSYPINFWLDHFAMINLKYKSKMLLIQEVAFFANHVRAPYRKSIKHTINTRSYMFYRSISQGFYCIKLGLLILYYSVIFIILIFFILM